MGVLDVGFLDVGGFGRWGFWMLKVLNVGFFGRVGFRPLNMNLNV